MDYWIVGGDERFRRLAGLLEASGRSAAVAEGLPARPGEVKNLVMNCPPRGVARDAAVAASKGGRLLLCGPGHPAPGEGVVDLWADEALVLENARLTAEGAVSAAMRASDRALGETRCLVVGWGRVGRALTELLVALGARVTSASRSEAGRHRALERGAEAVDTGRVAGALPGQGLIFNTAPAPVLGEGELRRADRDAMLIDLASPPYGIDLAAAWALGLRAWREPALPGRYCPQSAAEALLKAIERQGL